MNDAFSPSTSSRWPRTVLRSVALALLCGVLQALLPSYTLGTLMLPPLSVVLGVTVAAAMSRGRWTVPAALAGVLAANLLTGATPQAALAGATVLGLQALLAGWLMRHAPDADLLQLDTAPRLQRFVLLAAPAAALLGVLAGMLAQWGVDAAAAVPLSRPQLAGAVGRFVADAAGIIVVAPVLLCWLARPQEAWRPRRRLVALPLLAVMVVMLPGFDQVARRDETRLQVRFDREASLRQLRVQKLLGDPLNTVLALRGVLAAGGGALDVALFDQLSDGWMQRTPGLHATGWLEMQPTGSGDGADLQLRHAHAAEGHTAVLPGARSGTDGRLSLTAPLRQAIDKALTSAAPVALPAGGEAEALSRGEALLLLQSVPAGQGPARRLVFALVDTGALLANALPDDNDPNLRVCLTQSSAGRPARRLAGPPGCESDVLASAVRALPYKLALADQRLDLLVTEPATADNRLFTAVWLLALPAVTGTALLSALLLALSGRLRRIEDSVRERTAALRAEIDERRQAEARLAVSEQRFRAIFDAVNIGVTVVDPAGRIVDANPAFCTMMGCTAAELRQRPLSDIRLPDVTEDDGTAVAVGGGQARRQRYITADGRVLQVAASLRTLSDATGQPVATVGALQDLTQVLRLREAERERDEAEIASRTKSDFLARLSHELRAPLNAILGFAQMLGRTDGAGDAGQASHQHGLAQIRQAGWHLLDMINDVLDLSRMEAGSLRLTLEPVSLPDLAQEAMAMVEPAALQAQVTLALSLSPQAEQVQADPVRLRQVLVNLLGNAIKYNRPGGRVELRTRPGAVGEVEIEVEDTGIGMNPAQLGELFQPFNRLGRERQGAAGQPGSQGTGIGLVICRKLAGLMGGELSVTSEEGSGSVFSLRLPRPVGEPSRTVVSEAMPLMPQVSIGTVLYIEDDDADAEAMRQLVLQRPGITLVCAKRAAEGLARVAEVDLVLLDLDLPDRPGIEVLRTMQADTRLRGIPVIVVSAESRPQRIDECFDAGATHFLTKPLDPKQTLRAIDDSLGA
jgi:PAS domain S-box-containing protein